MVVSHLEKIDGVRKVRYSEGAAEGMTKMNTMGSYIAGAVIVILMAVFYFPCEQYSFCRSSSKRRRDSDHETYRCSKWIH